MSKYKYIDAHCHILPDVDDGAKDLEEARQMLQIAFDDGVRYVIATPHYHPKRGQADFQKLKRQLELLREEAVKMEEKMQIFIGHEVYYGQDVPELLEMNQILTLNGSEYVLVEFSPFSEEIYIQQAVTQLQSKGYKVVIAHAERYECVRKNMDFAEYLIEMGALIQVNAGSIIGERGREVRKFVLNLLDAEMVFCVGTDAHDTKRRPPHMKKAAEYVEKRYGEEYARRIFFSNTSMMLRRREEC